MKLPDPLRLAHLPTPLQEFPRLKSVWGGPHIWIKRDDLTGFGLSGNKIRKLEFHLAAGLAQEADLVLTCGAAQSNHCRATALAGARLGLDVHLFLRTPDGEPPQPSTGNHRLGLLAGAKITYLTPGQYQDRDRLLAEEAARFRRAGRNPWVIPEGASDWLGMQGMVVGFAEMVDQVQSVPGRVAEVWHAASSGGTTAGFGWASQQLEFPVRQVAVSVGEPADQLQARVHSIWSQVAQLHGTVPSPPALEYLDRYVGAGYGQVSEPQAQVESQATRLTGLLFDSTYTGKAIYALHQEITSGRFEPDDHVIFWHTGGGFAALA